MSKRPVEIQDEWGLPEAVSRMVRSMLVRRLRATLIRSCGALTAIPGEVALVVMPAAVLQAEAPDLARSLGLPPPSEAIAA